MNPESESKTLENISSDEEIIRDKISQANADVYCTPMKFDESQLCYSTGSNATKYFAFHFSAEMKRMHQAGRCSPKLSGTSGLCCAPDVHDITLFVKV